MYELSEEAKRVDEAFVKHSRNWGQFYGNPYNPVGYSNVLAGAGDVRKQLDTIKPQTKFEQLWADNIAHQIEVQGMLADYIHTNPKIPVAEMIDRTFGPGTYRRLESQFSNHDYAKEWKMEEIINERMKKTRPTNTKEAHEMIENYIGTLTEELMHVGREEGYITENFELNIDFGLPGTYNRPYWNSELKRFFLGYESFGCFDKNGELVLSPADLYAIAFHEIFGHAAQQIRSEKLPRSLQMIDETRANIPDKVIREGVALKSEFLSFDWMRQNAERLGINPVDVDIFEHNNFSRTIKTPGYQIFATVLSEMKMWEGLDVEKFLLELNKNPRVVKNYTDPTGSGIVQPTFSVNRMLAELCYNAGYAHVTETANKFAGADKKKLNAALDTGVWSWKVYPKAVEYFLNGK